MSNQTTRFFVTLKVDAYTDDFLALIAKFGEFSYVECDEHAATYTVKTTQEEIEFECDKFDSVIDYWWE